MCRCYQRFYLWFLLSPRLLQLAERVAVVKTYAFAAAHLVASAAMHDGGVGSVAPAHHRSEAWLSTLHRSDNFEVLLNWLQLVSDQ